MIRVIDLDDVGELVHAGPAPGRPEVEQHDLAFVVGNGERVARHVLHREVGKLGPCHQRPLELLRRFLLLQHLDRLRVREVSLELLHQRVAFGLILKDLFVK